MATPRAAAAVIPRRFTRAGAADKAAAAEAVRAAAAGTGPKVSVVIATYCSGDGLNRVMDSLLAQTLPPQDLEIIFVDDGSPDDTWERVQALEQQHANVRAFRIPNSGWPSQPRNVGIDKARGEYLFFMDHDDSVYPDGLRRSYEYARETDADLMSPKEGKTNDVWWGMSSWRSGNLAHLEIDEVRSILPLVPHKLYRRSMVLEHNVRFPEGARVLWEDQFFNVDAFRHSRSVSVLTDTSAYLWHGSDTNSSHTFHPSRRDFWQRLEQLLTHIRHTLRGREYQPAADILITMHMQVRVIDRMVRLLTKDDGPDSDMALRKARKLLRRFASDAVIAALPRKHQIQAQLLDKGRRDLLVAMHQQDLAGTATARITDAAWHDGRLRLTFETMFTPVATDHPILRRDGDRVLLALPREIVDAVDRNLLDVTDLADELEVYPVLRGRAEYMTWALHDTAGPGEFVDAPKGLSVRRVSQVEIDPQTAAVDNPLADDVFDFKVEASWAGMTRHPAARYEGGAMPAIVAGRPMVAYANKSKALSLDISGTLRSIFSDAVPQQGAVGTTDSLLVPLTRLSASVPGRYSVGDLALVAEPDQAEPAGAPLDEPEQPLLLELEVEQGAAHLVGRTDVAGGTHRIFARRGETWHRSRHALLVGEDGAVTWVTD